MSGLWKILPPFLIWTEVKVFLFSTSEGISTSRNTFTCTCTKYVQVKASEGSEGKWRLFYPPVANIMNIGTYIVLILCKSRLNCYAISRKYVQCSYLETILHKCKILHMSSRISCTFVLGTCKPAGFVLFTKKVIRTLTNWRIGYPKPTFRVLEVPWWNRFKASQTRLFFIFCQYFGIVSDDFSKWSAPKSPWNFEISSNTYAKNEEKFSSTCHKLIFRLIPGM